jgi:hypothetical protein
MQGQIKNKVIFKPAVDSHDGSQIEKYLSHTKDHRSFKRSFSPFKYCLNGKQKSAVLFRF